MKASMKANGLALAGFATACTLMVALVNHFTKDTIIEQRQKVLLQTLNTILPASSYDNALIEDCVLVTDAEHLGDDNPHQIYRARKQGQGVAAVIETVAPDGYSGSIQLMVALNIDGTITGVKVLNHKETPGLGDKIEERKSDWIYSFNDKKVIDQDDRRWAVKKDNGMFDQFTGATITPRAVVGSVKRTALYFAKNQQQLFAQPSSCNTPTDSQGASNE